MHIHSLSLARPDDRPVDPWALLTGNSVGIVAGFGVDLVRLGVHQARQAFTARATARPGATRGWPCPGPCDAGAR